MKQRAGREWPPGGLSGWLVRKVVAEDSNPKDSSVRTSVGVLEGWTSTIISVVLSSLKLLLGWFTGSISLLADGINNLADVGSSLVVVVGFRWSRKPRDLEHPFGHGRIETVAALVLSITLIMVGVHVATESFRRLVNPQPVTASPFVLLALVATIVIKEWLALFAATLARATESKVMEADSWNHHFDVLSTGTVVLALIGAQFGIHMVDGAAGVLVSVFILVTGGRYARQSISTLLGEAPTDEELGEIHRSAANEAGVVGVHDIIMHKYGDVKIASLHIEVDAARTALDAHDLAEDVERAVEEQTGCKAIVHVDPVDRRHPLYARAENILKDLVRQNENLVGFHDLRILGESGSVDISVDIVAIMRISRKEHPEIVELVCGALRAGLPGLGRATVTVETPYSKDV